MAAFYIAAVSVSLLILIPTLYFYAAGSATTKTLVLVVSALLLAIVMKWLGQKRAKKLGLRPFPPPWQGLDP